MTNSDSNLEIIPIAIEFLKLNVPNREMEAHSRISIDNIKRLLDLVHDCWCFEFAQMDKNVKKWKFIDSTTELQESGVQFKKAKGNNLFDIKFISGTLEIPQLCIEDKTESFLTNLVAFELRSSNRRPTNVCEYIVFMNSLVNSSKDVRLLRRGGIIESWAGDDKELYHMFHKLFKITQTDPKNFGYSQVFNDVNYNCK
ncbi:putative UPF0481 protein [Camellia lanceoleosa]|uniref:UPF0481 protein n=1 Tax=Camellia lanceoleosa TaxID=1840588 RepID=A0ACC0HD54_9ERIC|nr:putative UPF0481 protein [Camellia lanceoleosa]